jgi:hypothetical protein
VARGNVAIVGRVQEHTERHAPVAALASSSPSSVADRVHIQPA